MQYFNLGVNKNKLRRLSSAQTEIQENVISSYSLDENQLKFYYYSPEQAKTISIKKEVNNMPLNPLEMYKDGTLNEKQSAKVNTKVQEAAKVVTTFAVVCSPFIGMHLAALALNLTMIIQLFHKTILFKTKFGPKLEYFLLASSDVLDSLEDDDEGKRTFEHWKSNPRLVEFAELNTYTIDEFPLELIFLFGFMILRFFRAMIKKYQFRKWEAEYGKGIYKECRDIELEKRREITEKNKEKVEVTIKKKPKNVSDLKVPLIEEAKELTPEAPIITKSGFELTKSRKFILKIFCLTYILELILLCRLMDDLVLTSSFNMYNITYSINTATVGLVFNHLVSMIGLSILIYECLRLVMTNNSFARIEINKRRDLAMEVILFQRLPTVESDKDESSDESSSEYETDSSEEEPEVEA